MTELLTVQMLAKMTGKTERAIYADIARGKWPHVKLGRRVFFRPETVERFIQAHEIPASEETLDPRGGRRVA